MTRSYRSHGKPDEVGYRLCADVAFGRISVKAVDLRGQPNSKRHSAAIERRIEPSGRLAGAHLHIVELLVKRRQTAPHHKAICDEQGSCHRPPCPLKHGHAEPNVLERITSSRLRQNRRLVNARGDETVFED